MPYKQYGRFGLGIDIHQNGEVSVALTGMEEGRIKRVGVELTEKQATALLADLAEFATSYIHEVVTDLSIGVR